VQPLEEISFDVVEEAFYDETVAGTGGVKEFLRSQKVKELKKAKIFTEEQDRTLRMVVLRNNIHTRLDGWDYISA